MIDTSWEGRVRRDVTFLKLYSIILTLVVVGEGIAIWIGALRDRHRFDVIDVERVNIVDPHGRVRLVLSNAERQAQVVIDGRTIRPNRKRPAGAIFFNEEGDEVGGLVFTGRRTDGSVEAFSGLTLDQFKQDQTVALRYSESGGRRLAGLEITDRHDSSLALLEDLYARFDTATSAAERASIERELVARGGAGRSRVFVGKDFSGSAILSLADAQGKPRLMLGVDPSGAARVQFLDPGGIVIRELTP